jgi:hypothetical protein
MALSWTDDHATGYWQCGRFQVVSWQPINSLSFMQLKRNMRLMAQLWRSQALWKCFLILAVSLPPKNNASELQNYTSLRCANTVHIPKNISLDVPYFDQADNAEMPWRSSQVTAVASVLAFYGIQALDKDTRLPDEVSANVRRHGDLVNSAAMVKVVSELYHVNIRFTTKATWCDVLGKLWITPPSCATIPS